MIFFRLTGLGVPLTLMFMLVFFFLWTIITSSFHLNFSKLKKWKEAFWPSIFRFFIPQITLVSFLVKFPVKIPLCSQQMLWRTYHPCFSVPSLPGRWHFHGRYGWGSYPIICQYCRLPQATVHESLSLLSFPPDRICFRTEMCTVEHHVLNLHFSPQIYAVIPRAVQSV